LNRDINFLFLLLYFFNLLGFSQLHLFKMIFVINQPNFTIMKNSVLLTAIFLIAGMSLQSQVAVNTTGASPDATAIFDVSSPDKGFLLPRMTNTARTSIPLPAKGLLVYDSTFNLFYANIGTPASPGWTALSTGNIWSRSGSSTYLTNSSDFVGLGTSSPVQKLDVSGNIRLVGDIYYGSSKLLTINTPYSQNTFIGITGNTTNTGNDNTFVGYGAGAANTSKSYNTYVGSNAGLNATGGYNVIVGSQAGFTLTTGSNNVMIGYQAGPATGNSDHELYINHQSVTPLIYGDFNQKYVGICTETPGTEFAIFENNTHLNPASLIEQGGAGDAAQRFFLSQGQSFCLGIDNSDNDNFRISSGVNLGASALYGETTTMMRIHTENPKDGIIDFNHQSRTRIFLSDEASQMVPGLIWTPVIFDQSSYDEHLEWNYNPGASSQFIASEEGYYQINARTEFLYMDDFGSNWCSIAIFKNGTMYAQGNNLKLSAYFAEQGANNNAPNVGDVVYLQAGDYIDIQVYHTVPGMPLQLKNGESQTYCSIHKVS